MRGQKIAFDGGRLEQLRDLAIYPCADVYPEARRELLEEYGIDCTGRKNVFEPDILMLEEDERARTEDAYFELVFNKSEPCSISVPKNWGIQRKYLERLDMETLYEIHYGRENLRVPTEMLDLENPFEILANYLAAGILKPCNRHQKDDVPRGHFSELVKFMNKFAYGNKVFSKAYQTFKGSNRFPVDSGYQVKRLSHLSGEVKRQFCASFFKDNFPSRREEPYNPCAYFVPATRNGLLDNLMSYFRKRFERERYRELRSI